MGFKKNVLQQEQTVCVGSQSVLFVRSVVKTHKDDTEMVQVVT